MIILRDQCLPPEAPDPICLALGVFDGVHLGHQSILRETVAEARKSRKLAAALTFDPHPLAVIRPDLEVPQLSTIEERAQIMESLGLDYLFVRTFDQEFSGLDPERFMADILRKCYRASCIFVGFNFNFGRGGRGTPETLRLQGPLHGLQASVYDAVRVGRQTVSSTAIRHQLVQGRVGQAWRLLGRPYSLTGEVVPGDGRGRGLGFPTANLELPVGRVVPKPGVYAVRVEVSGTSYNGMANIGSAPTFGGGRPWLEVHLCDFSGNLYGQTIRVHFITRLRPERQFAGSDELGAQLERDRLAACRVLKQERLGGLWL